MSPSPSFQFDLNLSLNLLKLITFMASVSSMLVQTHLLALVFFLLPLTSPAHGLSGNVQRITRSNNGRWWMRYRGQEEDGGGSSFVHGCKASDIIIAQAVGSPLSNGIPTYSVQFSSTCELDCRIWNLHVSCGLFASAKLVNPRILRRMGPNDCIVNDGKPLESGVSLFCVRQFFQLSHGRHRC